MKTMKTMIQFFSITALAWGLAWPVSGFAQTAPGSSQPSTTQTTQSLTDGEVRKVDLDAGKVTIRHGEIKHLDMPGMTMVFTAKDKSLLANLKPGDKIKFLVVNEGGRFMVTAIEPAP